MTRSYLVEYGRSAFVGRFTAASAGDCARGDQVVLQGPRGVEIGTVLCEALERFASDESEGELLRTAGADDALAAERAESHGQAILEQAERRIEELGLPLGVIDVEVSLDRRSAILHALPWGECDATTLFEELSTAFAMSVRLFDLSRVAVAKDEPAKEAAGCGKPGCGTEGGGCSTGGCSTGGCSRGKVKSAKALTSYFADLREKMEADSARRMPLA